MTDPLSRPNPGSSEAVAMGCICPVIDNHHGKGIGSGLFWYTQGCPVHCPDVGEVAFTYPPELLPTADEGDEAVVLIEARPQ